MPMNQESVQFRVLQEEIFSLSRQCLQVLAVFQNRNPLTMLVRRNAAEAFQHFIALDEEPAIPAVKVRQRRAVQRMSVQDRASPPRADYGQMKECFGRWFAGAMQQASIGSNLDNLVPGNESLVDRACSYRDRHRVAVQHDAEVPARAQEPASTVKISRCFDQLLGCAGKCHADGNYIREGSIIGSVKESKGRGAASNPANRFEKTSYEVSDWDEPGDPSPHTLFLKDSSKSIINYNDSPDVGFTTSINPYRGCEHGCIYCLARPNHEYLGFSAGLDFETRILVKEDAPELLRREISSKRWEPQVIAISGVTDAYQPVEKRLKLTRRCLEVLAEFINPVVIVTKNELVTRDIDLLAELARHDAALVFVSVTSLDGDLARELEPRASQPACRLAAIEALSAAGIPTGVLIAPVIPGLTDHEMPAIIAAVAKAGAKAAGYVTLRLPYAVAPLFEEWLSLHRPGEKEKVLNRIRSLRGGRMNDPEFGSRLRGEGPIAEQIAGLFEISCRKAGINSTRPKLSTDAFRRPQSPQMRLF